MEELGRIKTHIQGFDDILNGGIPHSHIVLVLGEPGTMKSSIVFYILNHNALTAGLKGAYITLEQSRDSLLHHMANLGMEYSKVEDKVTVVDLALIRKNLEDVGDQTWTQIFKMYAKNLKKNMDFDILVLDSLPVLELLASFGDPRNDLFRLFEWLRELDCTVFLVSEMTQSGKDFGRYGEDFIADGIIHLTMDRVGEVTVQRRIRCVKMRSTNHSTDYFSLLFNDGAFQVTRVIGE